MKTNRINKKDKPASGDAQSNNESQAAEPFCLLSRKETALLKKLVGDERAKELLEIGVKLGVSPFDQLASAAQCWISYYRRQEKKGGDFSEGEMRGVVGALNPEQWEHIVSLERQFWISARGRDLYMELIGRIRRAPLDESMAIAEGLLNLVQWHPGFADERASLGLLLEGYDQIGMSNAIYHSGLLRPPVQAAA